VFRSGCCWERGHGRIFYFRPGHEAYPTYFDANVRRVIRNAVQWAAPRVQIVDVCPESPPLEKLSPKNLDFGRVGIVQGQGDIA
jgi:trehalose utilization protein